MVKINQIKLQCVASSSIILKSLNGAYAYNSIYRLVEIIHNNGNDRSEKSIQVFLPFIGLVLTRISVITMHHMDTKPCFESGIQYDGT